MTEATDEEVAELRTRFRVNDYGVVSGWIVAKLLARLERQALKGVRKEKR